MRKAHFIGICGAGMSAVAALLVEQGWQVSGSDEGFYPPVSDYLRAREIPCRTGYAAGNIPPDAEMIVIGKHAKLVSETNDEVRAALQSGIPVRSFPEVLHQLTTETKNLVVAGSFGKSTCSSLAAWTLVHAGKDPSYFIGAISDPIALRVAPDGRLVLDPADVDGAAAKATPTNGVEPLDIDFVRRG